MHTARYKQIKNPILLLQNSIAIIICALGALANKFLAICYCHNVEQTGCYMIILIKNKCFTTATLLGIQPFSLHSR